MAESVKVPNNYHCPFCPDHEDDTFFYSNGAQKTRFRVNFQKHCHKKYKILDCSR